MKLRNILRETTSLTEGLRLIKTFQHGNRTAKIYRDVEWEEYRVRFYVDGKYEGEAADYHSDKDDAIDTASNWVQKAAVAEESTVEENHNQLDFSGQLEVEKFVDRTGEESYLVKKTAETMPSDEVLQTVRKLNKQVYVDQTTDSDLFRALSKMGIKIKAL